ncbi:MAG: hypothetical protein QOK16_2483, partial [Solirubrobacteraceae bacterium]|nr:hypothetical protein [Solirubrobacteraceae bacterium]
HCLPFGLSGALACSFIQNSLVLGP